MNTEDAEEYTQSLGQIVAGSWRQIAWADRQGIPAALGLRTREWVEQRLGGYVRLAIPERREAVAELTAEGMRQSEVAEVLGVDRSTVTRDAGATAPNDEGHQDISAEASASAPDELTAEERAAKRAERERREAIRRQVDRLLNFLDGWDTVVHLGDNPLRSDVLAALDDFDRRRLVDAEERIRRGQAAA